MGQPPLHLLPRLPGFSMANDSPALYISRLDVNLSQRSQKRVEAIKLQMHNKTLKDFRASISPGGNHNEIFVPALVLSHGDQLSLSVKFHARLGAKKIKINMDHGEIRSGMQENEGIRTYQKSEKTLDITISLHLLPPTTNDIIQACPRFRVLVIGNSGVGKSSLINKVFGVDGVHVCNDKRGVADIDKEFVSAGNERFVLHDSNGFEEGNAHNVNIVKDFVKSHTEQSQIKDRLHAVWMCLEIPYSGGRLLQSATEDFFRRRREILGEIPLVIVLTKVDLLDEQLNMEMEMMEMEGDSDGQTFDQRKAAFLEEHCLGPLRAVAAGVPHVIVSTEPQYSTTPAEIIKITKDRVNEYIGEEASMVFAMAQRASIKVNIESSIAIGRKKYWSQLAKSAFFPGCTLKECVQVLHRDIIAVWNFDDPDELLRKDDFIGALLHAGDLEQEQHSQASPPVDISPVMGLVNALAGASPEPTLLILCSVVGAAIWLAQLARERYQRTAKVVKLLMCYIVGAMFAMQIILLLTPEGRVTSEVVEQAVQTYSLTKKRRVRDQVDGFDVLLPGPDHVLKQVELLIQYCSIEDDQIEELRQVIRQQMAESAGG